MKRIATCIASLLLAAVPAFGHGSMADPISRTYKIFLDNPQTPQGPAAAAAIGVAGTQAFYDWNEVSRLAPGYDYPSLIPDGQLPGAGREKYAGLNLARTDWYATPVVAGPRECRFYATTPHDPSFFKAYITRNGYDPRQPLRWSDLEPVAGTETALLHGSCGAGNTDCHCGTSGAGLSYYMTLQLPQRIGAVPVLRKLWSIVHCDAPPSACACSVRRRVICRQLTPQTGLCKSMPMLCASHQVSRTCQGSESRSRWGAPAGQADSGATQVLPPPHKGNPHSPHSVGHWRMSP